MTSCTKGIWLWGNYRRKSGNGTKILFIDSEGTSSIDRSTRTYDSKIFALVVLISSLFIYNTTSNIDEQGISELSLAAHLSQSIACNSSINKESLLSDLAPRFIWVLRDFTLEKVHPETNEEITSNEYLEICLKKKISGKNSAENNLIRENIMKYFSNRECVTLPRPVESEDQLKNLNRIKYEELKPNFKIEFMNLKHKVYKETKTKRIGGKSLDGPALANLLRTFVESINKGAVPNISSAWDSVIAQDIRNYKLKSCDLHRSKLKEIKTAATSDHLTKVVILARLEGLLLFNRIAQVNPEIHENRSHEKMYQETKAQLEANFRKEEMKLLKDDCEKKIKMNWEILKLSYKPIVDKIFNGHYTVANMQELAEDFALFLQKYFLDGDGSEKLQQLTKFINENLQEMIYYVITSTNSDYKLKLNSMQKHADRSKLLLNDERKTTNKLEEIDKVLTSRTSHLTKDIESKNKELKFLTDRMANLKTELDLVKEQQQKKATEKLYNSHQRKVRQSLQQQDGNLRQSQDLRLDSNMNRNNCECACFIF